MRTALPGRLLLLSTCGLALGLVGARVSGIAVPGFVLLGVGLVLILVVATGVFWLGSGVFARPILRGRADRPFIALTFDDGPDPIQTRRVLDLLDGRGHRATFFVIGARLAVERSLGEEICRRGHQLANHSWDHSFATPFRAPARLAGELDRTSALIAEIAGRSPRWFRPPVGLLSPRVVRAAARSRLALVGWSGSARDGAARTTVERALTRLEGRLSPGAIVVLHDGKAPRGGALARDPIAADLLPPLLDAIEARGLHSTTLDELLA